MTQTGHERSSSSQLRDKAGRMMDPGGGARSAVRYFFGAGAGAGAGAAAGAGAGAAL